MNAAIELNAEMESYAPAIEAINHAVAHEFNITVETLKAKTRKREVVAPRQVAMFFVNEIVWRNITLENIAKEYGLTNHSTTIHALQTVADLHQYDKVTGPIITRLMERFNITELRGPRI